MNQERFVNFYLALSLVGALFIIALIGFYPLEGNYVDFFNKFIVGVIFIIGCIIGISFALKPNWINLYLEQKIHGDNTNKMQFRGRRREGHHPACPGFRTHTIQINNKVRCAGCTGLIIGASIAILLMCLTLFLQYNPTKNILIGFVVLGMVFIAYNFSLILIRQQNASINLFSNILLVIGFFLVISSFFQYTDRIIFGILGIMISFLWLDTRILLSKWHHQYICANCIQVDCEEKYELISY